MATAATQLKPKPKETKPVVAAQKETATPKETTALARSISAQATGYPVGYNPIGVDPNLLSQGQTGSGSDRRVTFTDDTGSKPIAAPPLDLLEETQRMSGGARPYGY